MPWRTYSQAGRHLCAMFAVYMCVCLCSLPYMEIRLYLRSTVKRGSGLARSFQHPLIDSNDDMASVEAHSTHHQPRDG